MMCSSCKAGSVICMIHCGGVWQLNLSKIWQNLPRYGKILQNIATCHWQCMASYDKIWQDSAIYGKIWQDLARDYKILQIMARCSRHVNWWPWTLIISVSLADSLTVWWRPKKWKEGPRASHTCADWLLQTLVAGLHIMSVVRGGEGGKNVTIVDWLLQTLWGDGKVYWAQLSLYLVKRQIQKQHSQRKRKKDRKMMTSFARMLQNDLCVCVLQWICTELSWKF